MQFGLTQKKLFNQSKTVLIGKYDIAYDKIKGELPAKLKNLSNRPEESLHT
ncbi:MAG: hypothetical protein ACMUIA_09525 [bacterium]